MQFTEQGKQALKWLSESKEVEYRNEFSDFWSDIGEYDIVAMFTWDNVSFRIKDGLADDQSEVEN
jgi:hypothetical protein